MSVVSVASTMLAVGFLGLALLLTLRLALAGVLSAAELAHESMKIKGSRGRSNWSLLQEVCLRATCAQRLHLIRAGFGLTSRDGLHRHVRRRSSVVDLASPMLRRTDTKTRSS